MKKQISLVAILMLLFITIVNAQELCEELVQEVFEGVEGNCSATDTLNACYGFDSIETSFYIADETAQFASPSDTALISNIQITRTSAFDPEEEEWGVAYLRSDIEGSQEPLVILATGDVVIENEIDSSNPSGTGLFQSMNFVTAGPSPCSEAPNAVFVQSPPNVNVDLRLNGTPIRMGSTIMFGTLLDDFGRFNMWLAVIEGTVTINPDMPNAVQLTTGQLSVAPLLTDLNQRELVLDAVTGVPIIGTDNQPYFRTEVVGEFSPPVSIESSNQGLLGWDYYSMVELIPSSLLLYDVQLPLTGSTTTAPAQESAPCELSRASATETSSIFVGPGTNRGVRGILENDDWIPIVGFSPDPNGTDEIWWKIDPLQGTEADRWWLRDSEVVTRGDCSNVASADGSTLVPRSQESEVPAPATTEEPLIAVTEEPTVPPPATTEESP